MEFRTLGGQPGTPMYVDGQAFGLFDLHHHCGQKCGQNLLLWVDRGLVNLMKKNFIYTFLAKANPMICLLICF